MINRQHILISIVLISIFMLMGQMAVLAHSVEHPFHTPDQSCQITLHCEKSGNGVVSLNLSLPVLSDFNLLVARVTTLPLFFLKTACCARSPPFRL